MDKLERDIERALVGMVKRHGGLCLKWVCPGWSGVPDRIILLPHGRIVYAETKRPKGGEVRELQKWWHRKLRDLGFSCWVIFDRDDISKLEQFIGGGGQK